MCLTVTSTENIVTLWAKVLSKLLTMVIELSLNYLFQLENLLRRISMLIPESARTGEVYSMWCVCIL